jgi:hypothetical protein
LVAVADGGEPLLPTGARDLPAMLGLPSEWLSGAHQAAKLPTGHDEERATQDQHDADQHR